MLLLELGMETNTEDQNTPKAERDPRALNAYRHGLTGQVVVRTPEDEAAYTAHCQNMHQSLAPDGGMEVELTQDIADDRWRLKKAVAMQENLFAMGLATPAPISTNHPEVDAAFSQARVWLTSSKEIALYSLYEHRIQRKLEKNLAELRNLQEDRRKALQQAVEEASLLAQAAASKAEPFDLECDFPLRARYPQLVFSNPEFARLVAYHRRLAAAKEAVPAAKPPLRRAA